MRVLGISALYHDSSAALLEDGKIIAAVQEERYTRIKHDPSLPKNSIKYCLNEGKCRLEDLDAIVFYDNPFLTLNRFISNCLFVGHDCQDLLNHSLDSLLLKKIWVEDDLRELLGTNALGKNDKLFFSKHHISHASSAFYPSPYPNAAIITVDGVGEWTTTAIGYGNNETILLDQVIEYPHSIGLLYSAFTYFTGFRVNYGDYKLMGLAPYGEPTYYKLIKENLIDIKDDGSYRLNLDYFGYMYGREMTNESFERLFNGKRRKPESEITKREADMAASIQKVVEEVIVKMAIHAKKKYGAVTDNLVMAGGVALNCVANGVLKRENIFNNIWVQPAAGDAGGALGAAYYYYYTNSNIKRVCDGVNSIQKGSFWGPSYDDDCIKRYLDEKGYKYYKYDDGQLIKTIADFLDEEMVIGLARGRMEYGPRALGNRSIIADPRSESMQKKLNLKIKHRESFRPFAPAVLSYREKDYFTDTVNNPYMLFCTYIRDEIKNDFCLKEEMEKNHENMIPVIEMKRSSVPAVTHVDYSARVQTVDKAINPFFYELIKKFEEKTGCGMVVNTSFNVRGEPIVLTPKDACICFMSTDMDVLVLGNYLLIKEEQDVKIEESAIYELD
ncbi:carbamoyltransferase [Butyrivibrio proteoclasticus]|uniref:Carbamoyltransferase n=1 Tax=Butyrivibrio proteoclasticus TaxID=43305 RepID=A0A1I5VVE7_9FIRM|nr:carbamoyltransferase N-terminal domain-containing protein [Butyrivibrio proteoclasticus]SFQ11554.1 carbamoyltransferase [Butyrivibrio proteoclasticus]